MIPVTLSKLCYPPQSKAQRAWETMSDAQRLELMLGKFVYASVDSTVIKYGLLLATDHKGKKIYTLNKKVPSLNNGWLPTLQFPDSKIQGVHLFNNAVTIAVSLTPVNKSDYKVGATP